MGKLGSLIYFTPMALKVFMALSYKWLILMGPSSELNMLQGPAHNLDTGHNIPQDKATGLSDKMVLAAPYQFSCSI